MKGVHLFYYILSSAYPIMTLQEYRQHLADPAYVTAVLLPLYQQEENLPRFARMRLMHQFFQSGILRHYPEIYLDRLCAGLDQVLSAAFAPQPLSRQPAAGQAVSQLLSLAKEADLEDLLDSLRFYELIFSGLEAYEVCANIAYLQSQVKAVLSGAF
ncbi:MAG: hypothetical protein ACO1O1_16235 [Adhaeribacter sp.]